MITKDCGLGHESSGIVVKVGKNVKTFDIGMLFVQLYHYQGLVHGYRSLNKISTPVLQSTPICTVSVL